MNPNLLLLLAAAAAAYAFKDKLGLDTAPTAAAGHSDAPAGPDYARAVQTATGIPPSDGINPGVMPNGDIRTQAPATPTEALRVAQATGSSYVPVVIDGNWTNAPTGSGGAAASIYTDNSIANAQFGKPKILPAPTPDMLREISYGSSIDDLLGAAASAKFQYGGQTAFTGYSMPVYGWNYYLQRFDPGQKMLTGGDPERIVDAETYWGLRSAAGLSGIGFDGGYTSRWPMRYGSDGSIGAFGDHDYDNLGLGCSSNAYGSHPLS